MNTPTKIKLQMAASRFVVFNDRAVRFEDGWNKSIDYGNSVLEMLDEVLKMLDIDYDYHIKSNSALWGLEIRMHMMQTFVTHDFSAFQKHATFYRRFVERTR